MKLRINFSKIYILLIILSFPILVGFSRPDSEKYLVTYQQSEKTVECITADDGTLLLPLYDILDLINYQHIECGRCGKDEIFSETDKNKKGHLFVNWDQSIITYSSASTVQVLDSANERIDGITYTSSMLYTYLGFTIQIDTDKQTIEILDSSASASGSDSSVDNTTSKKNSRDGPLVYVYDPSCTSCKKITALLDNLTARKGINLYKIIAEKGNKTEISKYETDSQVPDVIRGIYPIVLIDNQYLFNAEITEKNINKLLRGETVQHAIEYPTDTNIRTNSDSFAASDAGHATLIYFYSTTCASCKTAVDYMNQLKIKFPDLNAVGYNLYVPENITLLKAYGKKYGLKPNQLGDIPAVFISDQALIGDKAILSQVELLINAYSTAKPTTVIDPAALIQEQDIVHGLAVFGAGLLNGLNPCSLSMFLFLFSLIMLDRKKILKTGLSFCFGKFLMFFLLGTIFYKLISRIDAGLVSFLTKDLMMIFIFAFTVLNLYDFIQAKNEKYDKLILQLPSKVKKFNHSVMRRIARNTTSKYFIVIMILLGMLLALGEFMCTGQIYLTSIIVLIQGSRIQWIAVLYLILYSFAFIVPLLIMTLLIYFGKKVFALSEGLLARLPLIKVISSVLFILFGLYLVLR